MSVETADIIIGEAPDVAQFRALLAPAAEGMGYEIVRIRFMGGESRRILQIMAERADGTMNVEGCTELSRALSAVLDVEDPIDAAYDLEVSSPGIDRPLTRAKDFDRYQGFEAKLETSTPIDGRRRFKGILEGVEADEVLLRVQLEGQTEPEVLGFAFGFLSEAKLVLTDELIRHDLSQKPQSDEEIEIALDETKLN